MRISDWSSDVCSSDLRSIPFDKLVLSQSNVRRIKRGVSTEELAEDIARRGLLENLNVRPVLDADGAETGTYEVPAGGRRFQANGRASCRASGCQYGAISVFSVQLKTKKKKNKT